MFVEAVCIMQRSVPDGSKRPALTAVSLFAPGRLEHHLKEKKRGKKWPYGRTVWLLRGPNDSVAVIPPPRHEVAQAG